MLPEKNKRRAYLLQRYYSQNKSDNYYLLSFAGGVTIGTLLGQSVFMWGYCLAWSSLFYSLYEFHGETILNKYDEYMNNTQPLYKQIQEESEQEEVVKEKVKHFLRGSDSEEQK